MSLQKLIRVSAMVVRRADISEEEFHRYWADVHGPLIQDMLVRCGIVKYVQFHITPEHKALYQPIGVASPYDGIADFYVHRYEDMTNIYTDPIYMEQVRPDEERFLDLSKIVFTVGVDYVVVEDGKAVQHEGDSAF